MHLQTWFQLAFTVEVCIIAAALILELFRRIPIKFAVTIVAAAFLFACATEDAPSGPAVEPVASGQDDLIRNAERAGPASIAAESTIRDWDLNVVREGSNGWTCLPDRPDTPGDDPWCVSESWINFLQAYVSQTEPSYAEIGFAYMLVGDTPVSNSDPYETEPTGPEDWVTELGSHLMMLIPGHALLEDVSTDHRNGGPWVMWPDTPYAHLMIPIDSR